MSANQRFFTAVLGAILTFTPQRGILQFQGQGATLHVLEGNEHEPFIRDSGNVVEAILDFVEGRPLAGQKPDSEPTAQAALSARETEVLTLLAEGQPNKVIAERLGIGMATVERHVASVYRKVGARGRADAALHAAALGLVVAGPGGR